MGKRKKKKQPIMTIPENFLERMETVLGPSQFRALQKTFVERPTTFRVNTIKANTTETIRSLQADGFSIESVSWYRDAYILKNKSKRELTETTVYLEGKIYIQSLASMVPPLVMDPQAGERVLDLTAAPGSKTSQIAALMNRQGELVANDVHKVRFFKLKHNMEHLGVVSHEDDSDWDFDLHLSHGSALVKEYPDYFDRILLDAPCSAEARFVEDKPKTFGYWKEQKIKEMAYKQRQLLLSSWQALKPGGVLVYSTCTFAPEENEVQISRLIDRFGDDVEVVPITIAGLDSYPPVLSWKGHALQSAVKDTLRIKPTGVIEGFFVACLQKKRV